MFMHNLQRHTADKQATGPTDSEDALYLFMLEMTALRHKLAKR